MFEEAVKVEGGVANGPAPEDSLLEAELQSRLKGAVAAAEHHSVELSRAQRIGNACQAGLEQLRHDQKPAQGGMTSPEDIRY